MKKIFLFIFFIIIFSYFSCADSFFSWHDVFFLNRLSSESNKYNSPARIDHCLYYNNSLFFNTTYVEECSSVEGTNTCNKLYDGNPTTTGEWATKDDGSYNIPPNTPSVILARANNLTWDFNAISVFLPSITNPVFPIQGGSPNSFTISFYYDNSWHELIAVHNFSNDIAENCSFDSWNTNQVWCGTSNLSLYGVSKIKINISSLVNNNGSFNMAFPEVAICGNPSIKSCNYPLLFCDDFNYDYPIILNNWLPQDSNGEIDTGLSPINDVLDFTSNSSYMTVSHEVTNTKTHWIDTATQESSDTSPVYSSEFYIKFYSGNLRYVAGSTNDVLMYDFSFYPENGSIYYASDDGSLNYCWNGTLVQGQNYHVKINAFLTQRASMNYNDSVLIDHTNFYINGVKLCNITGYINKVENLKYFSFIKNADSNFILDNYYVMAGTSRTVDDSRLYFTDYFNNGTVTTSTTKGSGDLAQNVYNLWDAIGLKSLASRVIFGIIVILVLISIYIGYSLIYHTPPSSTVIIIGTIFIVILEVYSKLLPKWIIFILILLLIIIALGVIWMRARTTEG